MSNILSNAIIVHHQALKELKESYHQDPDFGEIMESIEQGQSTSSFSLKDRYLLKSEQLCVTQDLHKNVLEESHSLPYANHRGISSTTRAIERYFFRPRKRKNIHHYVT